MKITSKIFKKITEPGAALSRIYDDSIIALSGFNLAAAPEHLILNLYDQYERSGHPKGLFIIGDSLPAVPGRALDAICEKIYKKRDTDFLRGLMMPFLGFSPFLQKLVEEDMTEAHSWPIGIAAYWFREIASGRPGLITKIGIDTLLDPRKDGGALNNLAIEKKTCRISLVDIEGEQFLFYHAPKPNYALLRASVADELGNLSMIDEGIRATVLNMAQATKARPNPGTVIAQVRWITKSGTMNAREVDVPFPLVDQIVVSPKEHHWQSGRVEYDPRLSYRVLPPVTEDLLNGIRKSEDNDIDRVIARRVLLELIRILELKGCPVLVNLGVGIPALLSLIAAEEDVAECIVTVLESGPWGGVALTGTDFGLALSPFALSTIPDMFSNFEGGVIDAASLGFLQVDSEGDVNPSVLPGRFYGPGGFPVIAGGSPRIYFAGGFTAGPSKIKSNSNGIEILEDGPVDKFVEKVYKTFFSGKEAMKYEKEILYVTERAVMRLTKSGVVVEEIAPGVDLEKNVLKRMQFRPLVSPFLKEMDARLFLPGKMGVKDELERIYKS